MLLPYSWLHEWLPDLDAPPHQVARRLLEVGLEVEAVTPVGTGLPLVVTGRVVGIEELTGFNKPIRYCRVDTGEGEPRGIVCGAVNFSLDDAVIVALPGAELPGGFAIMARQTYGHPSDGMICSARELGLGTEHAGILTIDRDTPPGRPAEQVLADTVLDIAVTPDRGYALSLRGIAREVAGAFGLAFHDVDTSTWQAGGGHPVRVEDLQGCPAYLAMTIPDLDPARETPPRLRVRLGLAGMRAISLPVDATNAVMLELGAPLHAFDRDRLQGAIVVRRAGAGERLVTLDGVDRELAPEDLVIADDSGPVALAGVMGGERTEVTDATRAVVLEAAHFDPASVARTARRHRLVSEASRRFERYVDPAVAPAAARRFAELVGHPGPGPVTVVGGAAPLPVVRLASERAGQLAGRPVPAEVVRARLEQVGCRVSGEEPLEVAPPSWRPDLREPADLVEEVLRLEGYETIPVRVPAAPAGRGLTPAQQRRRALTRSLADAGLVEVATVPFTAADPLELPADDPRRRAVRLANPLSEEQAWLRTTLLPGLLAALVRNLGRGLSDVGLFETGSVFRDRAGGPRPATPPAGRRPSPEVLAALDAALPAQPQHLGLVLAGAAAPVGWWGPGRPADWADAVELARRAGTACGAELGVRPAERAPWHPGRCVDLQLGTEVIGQAGELHPRTCSAFDLPPRTCAAELDLTLLLERARTAPPAPQASPYPPAVVDVALVVGDAVPAAEVESALRDGAGALLERLWLLDLYTGPPVPPGARSLAYRLTFRALDRTLAGEEVNALRDRAVALAVERTGSTLRA